MIEFVQSWLADIQSNYGVNPVIFGIIYVVCVLPFWISIYKIIAGLKNRRRGQVTTFTLILGFTILAPFVYVAFFGRNLPAWFWVVAAVVISYSVYSVLRRIRKKKPGT
ncbi:MAG: hypothetical protein JSW02_05080 [candidate division WOR-3 bacterium]|nr:MAG: hypothetical protein JSW02_05080 [candidate division WOR-3 bacterium]